MKIFIASSSENLDLLREVEIWLEEFGHEAWPWDKPGLFPPGEQIFASLINISKQVDAAICLFGADDKILHRAKAVFQTRDNVLIEYGLFAGVLGTKRCIICTDGDVKDSADLLGLTKIDLSAPQRLRGRQHLKKWANGLRPPTVEAAEREEIVRIRRLEDSVKSLQDRLTFEEEKTLDLEKILQQFNVVNFDQISLATDGLWKLLYDYRYFQFAARMLAESCANPTALRSLLVNTDAEAVAEMISWRSVSGSLAADQNPQRNIFLARKALRIFRQYSERDSYKKFVGLAPTPLRTNLTEMATTLLKKKNGGETEFEEPPHVQ